MVVLEGRRRKVAWSGSRETQSSCLTHCHLHGEKPEGRDSLSRDTSSKNSLTMAQF